MLEDSIWRQPSALIPIGMSLAALAPVIGHAAMFGVAPQADEGTAAHTWQILMAGQLLVAAFFALKWLPREPIRALPVLAVQFVTALAAALPVWCFHW